MAPDSTPRQWPARPRGLLDGAPGRAWAALLAVTGRLPLPGAELAARLRRERTALRELELRADLEMLGESLGRRLLRDIGLEAAKSEEPHNNARLQEAGATADAKQEDVMAKDSTPTRWPSEPRGLLDDVAEAVRRAGLLRRFGRLLEALRGSGPAGLGGQMSATLEKGQCLALDGSRPATVECLAGAAWITCPAEGRDVQLRAGQAACIESPGNMVVAALGGPARIRMGWR